MDPNEFEQFCQEAVIIKKFNSRKQTTLVNNCVDVNPRVMIKHEPKPCDDCDRMVEGRVVQLIKCSIGTSREHWAKRCVNCRTRKEVSKFGKFIEK